MLIFICIIKINHYLCRVKIIGNKIFGVYVYPNDHPPPHCHIRFNNGSDISVDLPLIVARYGATISKEVKELIENNLEKLCESWEQLNGSKN